MCEVLVLKGTLHCEWIPGDSHHEGEANPMVEVASLGAVYVLVVLCWRVLGTGFGISRLRVPDASPGQ